MNRALRSIRPSGKNAVIALALLGAGFFAAWLRFRNHLGSEGAFTDGARTYDPDEAGAVRYAVWEAPEPLGEAVNTGASESRPALSPDGRWFVFAVGERGMNSDLYIAEMRGGKPVDPRPLAALDGQSDESSPAFAADALYFVSDRPGGDGGLDIYRASYADGEFGAAEHLGGGINSPADDSDPAPRPGTGELAFASNRRGQDFDLYVATRETDAAPAAVLPIEALRSPRDEREPAFTADGRTLFFASDRGNDGGDFDLYRSARSDGAWSAPVALAGLNTKASERGPLPASDDFSLYFARDVGKDGFDLLHARSIELFRLPGRPVGWVEIATLAALLLLSLLAWLAKRWPRLETLYKCYLVSVVVHLLLLWWSNVLLLESGGAPRRGRPDAIRIKVAPASPGPSAASRERAGRIGGEARPGAPGDAVAPERFASAAEPVSGSGSAPRSAVGAPAAEGPAVPGRESGGAEAAAPSAEIALADRGEIVRQAGAAPGLELGIAARGTGPRAGAGDGSGPERGRGGTSGLAETSGVPGAGTGVGAPDAPSAGAPPRGDVALGPGPESAGSRGVEVAAPAEHLARGSGGVAGLSLEALDGTGGGRAGGGAPERGGVPGRSLDAVAGGGGGVGGGGDSSSGGWIAALAPKAPAEIVPSGTRGSAGPGPGPASAGSVGLHDVEPRERIVEASPGSGGGGGGGGGSGSAGKGDVLGALSAPGGFGSRSGSGGSSPEKRAFSREERVSPPAPAALAMEAPEERPRDEPPPRPEKQRWENTPYRNREGEEKTRALELHGGSHETEAAVALGLAYLAGIQRPNGGFGDDEELDEKYGAIAIGKTGLSLLAFLGAGHTHVSGTPYSENVARAIAFLLARQDAESGHFGDSDAYNHGIATYALAECFALTGEAELRAPLERAVQHILSRQNHSRDPKRSGGWSYYYPDDRVFDRWPRTSITVWQVMALESARLGGLAIPEKAFDDAAAFIDNAEDPERGWYRYNHDPVRLGSAWPTLPASTPAALFALSLYGRDIRSEEYAQSREFVLTRAPREYRRGSENEFVQRGQGNLYFWYYGTLSMFRAGGSAWERWNVAMKETLVKGQRKDGSWPPIDVYCTYARDAEGDLSYSTAMCVLSLEVYYRYYLPLLKVK